MFDIEKVIAKRIALDCTYLTPHMNPAIYRHHKQMIETLEKAPRTEPELIKEIERVKRHLDRVTSVLEAEPIHNKLDALEWLLPKVRLRDSEHHREASFV